MIRKGLRIAVAVASLVIAAGGAVAHGQTEPQDARSSTAGPWPRLFVVVFERRVPAGMTSVGGRLRELRKAVTAYLAGPDGMRHGDHLVIFTEGMSGADWACVSSGTSCESDVRPLNWARDEDAARKAMAVMLRLPGRDRPGASRDADGVEYVHHRFDGDRRALDCLIASTVTGPFSGAAPSACPVEADGHLQAEARAISRVELTDWLQFSRALDVAQRAGPVAGVTWVWALLKDKSNDAFEARESVIRDLGKGSAPTRAITKVYDAARLAYTRQLQRTPHEMIRPLVVESAGTIELRQRLEKRNSRIIITAGSQATVLNGTLEISRSPYDGVWRPALDSLQLECRLDDKAGGRLIAGTVSLDGVPGEKPITLPLVARDGALSLAPGTALDAALRRAYADGRADLALTVHALVAGDSRDGFAVIPAAVSASHRITVGTRQVTAIEYLYIVLGLAAIVFAIGMAIRVLRPFPFEITVDDQRGVWIVDGKPQTPVSIDIRGYTTHVHRRIEKLSADVELSWKVFDNELPTRGSDHPVHLQVIGADTTPDGQARMRVHARLGSVTKPRALGIPLQAAVIEEDIDFDRIPAPRKFTGVVELTVTMRPTGGLLRLTPISKTVHVPFVIDVREDVSRPELSVRVFRRYRRLGVDADPNATATPVAEVQLANVPPGDVLARPVEINAAALTVNTPAAASDALSLVRIGRSSEQLRSGERANWHLELTPSRLSVDGKAIRIGGKVSVDCHDPRTGAQRELSADWAFDYIPFDTDTIALDIGTSGSRLWLRRSMQLGMEQVTLPLSAIDPDERSTPAEFPSAIMVDPKGRVRRVGVAGMAKDTRADSRPVPSPKGALLTAGDEHKKESARRDLASYVDALGRGWAKARDRHELDKVKVMATVPASYDRETIEWFQRLLLHRLAGAVVVCVVREAEAAAYFHLLPYARQGYLGAGEGRRGRFADAGAHRVIVVDMGAGTTDFVLVEIETSQGQIVGIRSIDSTFSLAAGDRYDELIASLFEEPPSPSRWLADASLRHKIRTLKQKLGELARDPSATVTLRDADLGTMTTTASGLLERLETFFVEAITVPLTQLRDRVRAEEREIDDVLIAGRGTLMFGCQERIKSDVRRLFDFDDSETLLPQESQTSSETLHAAVARGALLFETAGDVVLGDQDLTLGREGYLLVNVSDSAHVVHLFGRTDPIGLPFVRTVQVDSGDVRGAWMLMGSALTSESCRRLFPELMRGGSDSASRFVAATLPDVPGAKGIVVRLDHHEKAQLTPEYTA